VKDYKELDVWSRAVGLATEIYKQTGGFPESEKFGMASQMRRAVTSIPANIAEGWGRGMTKEYVHYLIIDRGSLLDLETHLIVARSLGYLDQTRLNGFDRTLQDIGKMLNKLIASLRSLC
jgi:four helix bundle protein